MLDLTATGGITPAYAGKSRTVRWTVLSVRDHPRVCGEKALLDQVLSWSSGSPPRMRGKGPLGNHLLLPSGITPEYAGKSAQKWPIMPKKRDHPRVCGEKSATPLMCFPLRGSPPRMRGKVSSHMPFCVRGGITPAYAGKSEPFTGEISGAWDHPRVCGEKALSLYCSKLPLGSPPRMRGKGLSDDRVDRLAGITPAYAGKRARL